MRSLTSILFHVITFSKEIPKEAGVRHENFNVAPHPNFPDHEVAIGGTLSAKRRTKLCSLLKENLDIFAWHPSDMTGVPQSIADHRLNIQEGYFPVRQKKRGQAPECAKAIPNEEQRTSYHQIQMAESDKEKTAFHTSQGVYCYTKMPFGLKNVGATYQRPVDKALDSQVGRNIEVYVDDLVIKRHTEAEMLRDALRKINPIEAQPKKITLGSQAVAEVFPSASHYGYYKPTDQTNNFTSRRGRTITKMERHAGRTQYHLSAKDVGERTDPRGFPYREVGRKPVGHIRVETPQEPWTLFTDGSSCVDGSGAGLILTSPGGTEFTYALRFQFTASNNEAEYEALIAGLLIMARMGVRNVHVSVDSKLVANQVLGAYVAKEENMIKYLEKVKSLVSSFANFSISQVPRSQNKKVDALSKIASTRFVHLSKQVLVEILKEKSIQEKEVTTVVEEDGPTWMTPIIEYLKERTLPDNRKEASKLRIKARQYELLEGSNGLVERANQSLGEGIKARLGKANKNWIEELPHDLWAHRKMINSSHDDTPFSLTYGTKAVIPVEIRMPTYCTAAVDAVHNDAELHPNLDLLEERHERAAIREAKAKLQMTKYYNARVRGVTFRTGDLLPKHDQVMRVAGGKLSPKWEGPYEVTEALRIGAYRLRSIDETILPRTWNIPNLKKCMDKSKITRKQSKSSKHGHENQKSSKRSQRFKAEAKSLAISSFMKPQGPILQIPKVIYN
ncbi:reverse transcriptase domain-containing protein [Tanacetum coccineum]|uniref:Reverse transcriptase domain-containing protein n=1 Tax=Tanacetum coccineum TaxID=301880 RepID=A0ABQ5CSU7_9ASTR